MERYQVGCYYVLFDNSSVVVCISSLRRSDCEMASVQLPDRA